MSNLEEKLNILKKKKLTAKTIVEQQRNEIRLLKSSLTIDERLQKIYENLPDKTLLNETIYRKIISNNHQTQTSQIDIHQLIENLSKIIEQILHLLSIKSPIQLSNIDCEQILVNQKESFQLIKWKLSDLYANRIADEIIETKMNFEDLNLPTGLLFGLERMNFRHGPSDIQSVILPYSLDQQSKRNLIVQSKTGTGKTISYLIHVLARLQSHSQALILLPTVELAFTIGSGIEIMSSHLPHIRITYAISSETLPELFETSIIIATIDVYRSYRKLLDLSRLQILVLDEIDTMIIREDYRDNLLNLFENLSANSSTCQILAYSSTLSEQIRNFTNELIPNSILIKQKIDKQNLNNIEQFYVHCQDRNRKNQFVNLIVEHFQHTQILVFCLNDQITEDLYENLIAATDKIRIKRLTTKNNTQERISLIENFRLSTFRIFLISAQTAATLHGIDLDHVNIVINYNMPQSLGSCFDLDYVTYHQRLDRCGRYDQHGYLFNLIETADEWNIQLGQTKYFSFIIEEIDLDRVRSLVL